MNWFINSTTNEKIYFISCLLFFVVLPITIGFLTVGF